MSRIVRNVLIGSVLAIVSSAESPLNNIDIATAEAVPTSCSAAQMTSIYNTCVDHCQSQLTNAMIECSDINTRYMLVKCAAETDKCGSAAGSTVVKEAQVQRLQDVCKTATKFPLADVKLLFASASDVAESTVAQKQVKDLADSFARNVKNSETSKGWRKGSERSGDNVTLSSTGGLYNSPSVLGGDRNVDRNGTLEHTMPSLEKRRQHTSYNQASAVPAVPGVPSVGQSSESGSPNKPHVSEGSGPKKGSSEQKSHSGVREYTWSKDSKSPEHKGTGKQESEGKGKSVGSGSGSGSGIGSGSGDGKPEYKGVGSGSVAGSGAGSAGVSGTKKVNSTSSTYSNTTQFKSSIKPNSVAKIVPAVSAVLAIALTAFFSL